MSVVKCPTCGASIEEIGREWRAHDAGLCKRLAGTKYLDRAKFSDPGIHWCPDLSDAAPRDVVLLHPSYRAQVLAEIERVKTARDRGKSTP
jgi:hypothetical protein